jgi:hypothetical protein
MQWPLSSQWHGSFLKENNYFFVSDQNPHPYPTRETPRPVLTPVHGVSTNISTSSRKRAKLGRPLPIPEQSFVLRTGHAGSGGFQRNDTLPTTPLGNVSSWGINVTFVIFADFNQFSVIKGTI